MPRKKQNVEAYGKSWSPIDLPNLEKAIKLYERLNYLQDHFANSLSCSQAIMQQINEKTDIQNELQKLGIKLTEDQAKEVASLLKHKQKENELLDKRNELYKQGSSFEEVQNRSGIKNVNNNISWTNAGSVIAGTYQQKYAQQQLNKNYEYYKTNFTSNNGQLITKLAQNKTVNDINNSSSKFSKAASIMQIAVNAFKEGVDIFVAGIKQGFNNQVNAYESTFSNIAARNVTTNDVYLSKQRNLNNELGSMGLADNIKTSDVQNMWNKLASNGASSEAMFAQGIENVITEKIVPYLDTSSVLWQQLQQSLGPTFVKQMRGINRATLDVADNTYYTEKIVNDMLPLMQYLNDAQEAESAKGMAESSGFTAKALDMGLSQTEVDNLTSSFSTLFTNPGKVITEGSAIEKYAWEQINQAGLSMNNPEDYAEILGILASTQKYFADMVPNANGDLMSSSVADVAINSVGGNYLSAKAWQDKSYEDIQKMVEAGNKAGESVLSSGEEATNDVKNGELQTAQDKRDTWLENITNDVAYLKEKFPTWFDIVKVAVAGLGGIIVGGLAKSVIGKGIGGLAGLSGGSLGTSSGLASLLGTAGPIALGVGAVAAGITTAVKIFQDGINEGVGQKDENASGWYKEAIAQGKSKGEAAAQGLLGFHANWNDKNGAVDITKNFNLTNEIAENLGIEKKWNLGSNDEINEALDKYSTSKDWKAYNKILLAKYLYKSQDADNAVLTLLISANLLNKTDDDALLGAIQDITGVSVNASTDFINDMIASGIVGTIQGEPGYGIADNVLNTAEYLKADNVKLKASDGTELNLDFNEDTLKEKFNLHREGLNKVPYDNYPALLHENETVLTASTANELRNLTDTYRETSQQSISFDTIIQNQTSALISKMDQIITAISNSNTQQLQPTWNTNATLNNMKHLRNLSSFNN